MSFSFTFDATIEAWTYAESLLMPTKDLQAAAGIKTSRKTSTPLTDSLHGLHLNTVTAGPWIGCGSSPFSSEEGVMLQTSYFRPSYSLLAITSISTAIVAT